MPSIARPMSEKDWRARDDAYTLSTAEEIKADPTRLDAARVQAKRMADEEVEKLKGLRKVARQKTTSHRVTGMKRKSAKSAKQESKAKTTHNVFTRI